MLDEKIKALLEEAEQHRVEYTKRSTIPQASAEAFGYWKGRRDEAGYFRDKLTELLKGELDAIRYSTQG